MPQTTTQRARALLTERDMSLLRHVAEFGGAEIEPLHRRFFQDKKIDAAKSTLRRLTGRTHRVLRTTPLDGKRVWYQLTHKGARVLGLSHEACRQFGHQARARRYALQWFLFVEGQMQRRSCNLRELPDLFPIRGHRLPQGNFYIATPADEAARFGYAVLDCGASPQRIARRVADTIERFLKHGWFDDFIRDRCFEVALLTITRSRKRAYLQSLEKYLQQRLRLDLSRFTRPGEDQLPIHIGIHVVPRLLDIIPGRSAGS